jgi:hypothetical protein
MTTLTTSLPVVRHSYGMAQHAVWADGSAADGALNGFATLCGQQRQTWIEVDPRGVTCLSCIKILKRLRSEGERV